MEQNQNIKNFWIERFDETFKSGFHFNRIDGESDNEVLNRIKDFIRQEILAAEKRGYEK